jgi:hypothetical protein
MLLCAFRAFRAFRAVRAVAGIAAASARGLLWGNDIVASLVAGTSSVSEVLAGVWL